MAGRVGCSCLSSWLAAPMGSVWGGGTDSRIVFLPSLEDLLRYVYKRKTV
jgi:hypothetical protein